MNMKSVKDTKMKVDLFLKKSSLKPFVGNVNDSLCLIERSALHILSVSHVQQINI